eukprot:gene21550-biopygen13204
MRLIPPARGPADSLPACRTGVLPCSSCASCVLICGGNGPGRAATGETARDASGTRPFFPKSYNPMWGRVRDASAAVPPSDRGKLRRRAHGRPVDGGRTADPWMAGARQTRGWRAYGRPVDGGRTADPWMVGARQTRGWRAYGRPVDGGRTADPWMAGARQTRGWRAHGRPVDGGRTADPWMAGARQTRGWWAHGRPVDGAYARASPSEAQPIPPSNAALRSANQQREKRQRTRSARWFSKKRARRAFSRLSQYRIAAGPFAAGRVPAALWGPSLTPRTGANAK